MLKYGMTVTYISPATTFSDNYTLFLQQYNLLHEFRDKFGSYKETRDVPAEDCASQ